MSYQGYISLHRSILDWEWVDDKNTFRLFTFLLLMANHTDKNYQGVLIKAGQIKTGRIALSEKTGLSEQQVRSCLNKLKSTGEITIKSYSKFSIISITNWGKFQLNNQQSNQQVTSNQPASNQQVTTNNNEDNGNNENNEKKTHREKNKRTVFKPPSELEVIEYSSDNNLNITGFYNYYESNGWMVGKNKMKDWEAAARGWSDRRSDKNNTKNEKSYDKKPGITESDWWDANF